MKRNTCQTTGCRKWTNLNGDGFCPSCKPPNAEPQEVDDLVCGQVWYMSREY